MMDDLVARAGDAAAAWGVLTRPPELIHARENIVFRVSFEDGRCCALRQHRPGYQTAASVHAELRLMETLADAGFACPWPQRTLSGALVSDSPERSLSSMVQWLDGAPLAGDGTVVSGDVGARQDVYRKLGGLLADLHLTADAVAPPDLPRHAWDVDAFCGPDPLWGRYWENPALTPPEVDLLLLARAAVRVRLDNLPPEQSGLIHGDVLQDNVLNVAGTLYLIDFDDCGSGPRLYDLATALIQHVDSPIFAELRQALIDGYLAGGGPLPAQSLDDLDMFVMLRAMVSAGWIMGRAGADDPRQRLYAERAVACARRFLRR
jgi:Ser/Thr protein kinase RdoA (MazF antagonist)